MSTNSFGTPNAFAPSSSAAGASSEPAAPVVEAASRGRRPLVLGGVAGAAVLAAVGAWFVLPSLLGVDVPEQSPLPAPAASAPAVEPSPEPEALVPTLTDSAGRNPFLAQVSEGGAGAGAPAAGSASTAQTSTTQTSGSTTVSGGGTSVGTSGGTTSSGAAGADGRDGAAGPAGPAGQSAEYVTVTFRGPGANPEAATFEVITREGLVTVDVLPYDEARQQTGSLDPTALTAATALRFNGFSGVSSQTAGIQFADSLPYTLERNVPFSLFTPMGS